MAIVRVPSIRKGLEVYLGQKLDPTQSAKVEALALEEWDRHEDMPYELLLDRFRRLLQSKLLRGVPTEASLRSQFGVPRSAATRLRAELLDDRNLRRKELLNELSSPDIKDVDRDDHRFKLCPVPDYLSPDLLTTADEMEADFRAANKPVPLLPERVRSRRAGYHFYEFDPPTLSEIKKRLK